MHRDLDEHFSFGPFRLSPGRRRLERDGVVVPLGSRALDILSILLSHAPDIVSKQALLDQVWPGLTVEEANLRFQMVALRKVLGDGEYVSTVKGRGYCFVEPFSRSAAPPHSRDTCLAVGVAAPVKVLAETNLPAYLSQIVGRSVDLAKVEMHLDQHRLVTVVGPGGVGKTRLAVEVARLVSDAFPAGIWLIDLAPLTDPDTIVSAVASVLGVALPNAVTTMETVAAALGNKRMLLIFDNCEHLVDAAAAAVKTLLEKAAGISVLATSQEALQIPSEQLYHLPPLALPSADTVEIGDFGAVDLFVERVRAGNQAFGLHRGNIAGVNEICRRLDGIPLALEMAAARLNILGVEGLRDSLGDRLRVLKTAQRGETARHGSLRATVEWSHGLLEPDDRRVFRCLGVFAGSFSLDAVVAVVCETGADRWSIVDALSRLIDKSLVTIEQTVPRRYRLLESLRLFAREQLLGSGDAVAEKHARYVGDLLRHADAAWESTRDADWIALYQSEMHNVRAALDWALAEPHRREIALTLAAPGLRFLYVFGFIAEGRRYCERLVPLIDDDTPTATVANILCQAAMHCRGMDGPRCRDYFERAVALYRQLGDGPRLGSALHVLGYLHVVQGRHEDGRKILAEAWELVEPTHLLKVRASILMGLGTLAIQVGRLADAREYLAPAFQLARASGSVNEGACLTNLSLLEYQLGNLDGAVELGRQAIIAARASPGRRALNAALVNLAAYLLAQDRPAEARPFAEEGFAGLRVSDPYILGIFQTWAVLLALEECLGEAAQLIGFVDAERTRRGMPRQVSEQLLYDKLMRRLEAGLTAAELVDRTAQGAHWTETQAMKFVDTRVTRRSEARGAS